MKIVNVIIPLMLAAGLFFIPAEPWAASDSVVDHGIYGELLKKYVKNGVVDYKGFRSSENRLDQYLKVLEKTNAGKLPRDERFAFYINVYNAWTIKLILGGYPGVESIKDLGSLFRGPWSKKICRIDGGVFTLDHIEHKILRPRFKDPRVHFAVNCASRSCPPLLSEPYRGADLHRQLDDSTRAFIDNARRNRLEENTLYVSKIFKWFSGDFNDDPVGFFLKYAGGDFKKELLKRREKIDVDYLDYDWSLNGK
ncbi:MAG: DUF547 domain-containing protein [Desulfobacterales bacterium]|nr:DUF547 domain-containing protein [Desulfobacterales bacterium]